MGDGLTGLTALAFGAVGAQRAGKYRQQYPSLAAGIAQVWSIKEETARTIGEPAAAVLADYIPDAWLQRVTQSVPPIQLLSALYIVGREVMAAESALVEEFGRRLAASVPAADEIRDHVNQTPTDPAAEQQLMDDLAATAVDIN